jgi:hypothetical protein
LVTAEANRVAHRVGGAHLCSGRWTVNAFLHFCFKKVENPQKTAIFWTPDRDRIDRLSAESSTNASNHAPESRESDR